jgi:hypothetical protein
MTPTTEPDHRKMRETLGAVAAAHADTLTEAASAAQEATERRSGREREASIAESAPAA